MAVFHVAKAFVGKGPKITIIATRQEILDNLIIILKKRHFQNKISCLKNLGGFSRTLFKFLFGWRSLVYPCCPCGCGFYCYCAVVVAAFVAIAAFIVVAAFVVVVVVIVVPLQ